jgi:TRAP-type C4-dicarboxylate transport system permease small subunit
MRDMRSGALRVQRILASISRYFGIVITLVASALLVFLVVALALQVFYRYALEDPLPWTEEAAGFALLWYAMLASAVASQRGQEFVFRWATRLLPTALRRLLRLLVDVVTFLFLVVVLLESRAYLDVVSAQQATATQVSMAVPYAGLAVGSLALLIVYGFQILDVLLSLVTKQSFSLREREEDAMYALLDTEPPTKQVGSINAHKS